MPSSKRKRNARAWPRIKRWTPVSSVNRSFMILPLSSLGSMEARVRRTRKRFSLLYVVRARRRASTVQAWSQERESRELMPRYRTREVEVEAERITGNTKMGRTEELGLSWDEYGE